MEGLKTRESFYLESIILKGRSKYIDEKGFEPNYCVLRPEQFYKLDFVFNDQHKNIVFAGMNLISSILIEENTMLFYFLDQSLCC